MTNKLLLAILLVSLVVGCETPIDNYSVDIKYMDDSDDINFMARTTRAMSNNVDSIEDDANGFVVYGLESNGTSWYEYLDGNRYQYDNDVRMWRWQTGEHPAWPMPFSTMNFYAYYPVSAEGFAVTSVAPVSIVGDIVVAPTILDQVDFLASCSGDVLARPTTGVLPLNFTHIMSKVSFSVMQSEGILTVIRQLGVENIIDSGSYDYINSTWQDLSNSNLGSFDDYVGSSGPFAKHGVVNQVDPIRIDGHSFMLIPQSGGSGDNQTPLWDGSVEDDGSGEFTPAGAYVSIRYRASSDVEDIVGYAYRETSPNDSEWKEGSYYHSVYKKEGGTYNGPLYVKAAFKLSSQNFNWRAGSRYDYTLRLNETGGIYLSEFYYDVDGTNTKIRVDGAPNIGDMVYSKDISLGVTVEDWDYSESNIFSI